MGVPVHPMAKRLDDVLEPALICNIIIELDIQEVGFEELLKSSDYISVNCDLNPTSFHLLDDNAFSLMKKNAVVINTARGPIIDERALERALESNSIAGAGLDVFEEEPLPLSSILLKHPRVMLAPHNSNSSIHAWEYVHINTINNLMDGLGLSGRL